MRPRRLVVLEEAQQGRCSAGADSLPVAADLDRERVAGEAAPLAAQRFAGGTGGR